LVELFNSRLRRKLKRPLRHNYKSLIEKIRKSKKETKPGDKPKPVKTHLRNTIIVPEMVGAVVGIHNGNMF